jgi:uncharacterized protein YkwD
VRLAAALVLVAGLGAGCLPSAPGAPHCAMTADEASLLGLANAERAQWGEAPLAADPILTCVARAWSAHLVAVDGLVHQDLHGLLPLGYQRLGENLAAENVGWPLGILAWALDLSPEHLANTVGPYRTAGVGLAWGSGRVWLTEDFGG